MKHSGQLAQITDAATRQTCSAPAERRRAPRFRTVFRIARVAARGDQGLARVQNISDEGLMIVTSMELSPGDALRIDLSDDCSLIGTAVWYHQNRCGVRLLRPIDSAALLRQLYEEKQAGRARPLRLVHRKRVLVKSERGQGAAALYNISQAGMKISHKGNLNQGLAVKVLLSPGIERRGVVRWTKDDVAGVALTEILSVEELGSMRSF